MRLVSISIKGIGGIDEIDLSFDRQMNFISGPNGIGKTTILDVIAHTFSGFESQLKRRALSPNGHVEAFIDIGNENTEKRNYTVSEFNPRATESTVLYEHVDYLISLNITRTFAYVGLDAVSRDPDRPKYAVANSNKYGVNLSEVKSWFVNRFLYSAHAGTLSETRLHNFTLAKKFFSLLDDKFEFKAVDAATNEIMVNTPSGEIYYEYLSSGFKSCLSILLGIVKEIEFRFKEKGMKIDEFDGVILIDELELHLHPAWQAKIASILSQAFPKAQFISTTHSPHIIQAAMPSHVIALHHIDGKLERKSLPSNEYGYQGWTIEEVLTDVMDLGDTRTSIYHETISEFQDAINKEDYDRGLNAFNDLDKLLHPENHLRKLLSFQLGAIKG